MVVSTTYIHSTPSLFASVCDLCIPCTNARPLCCTCWGGEEGKNAETGCNEDCKEQDAPVCALPRCSKFIEIPLIQGNT